MHGAALDDKGSMFHWLPAYYRTELWHYTVTLLAKVECNQVGALDLSVAIIYVPWHGRIAHRKQPG